MKFSCEQCQTKYNLPDERVRGKVLKIRCKKCGCQITVSQGGVRTAKGEVEEDSTMIGSRASVGLAGGHSGGHGGGGGDDGGEGGDSTMIGGMADFFAKVGVQQPAQQPDEWHLSLDGNVVDPMPLIELAQRIIDEQATPGRDIFVWREGQAEWLPPESIDEVRAAVEKAKLHPAPVRPAPMPTSKPAPSAGLDDEDEGGDKTQMGSLDFAALGLGDAKAAWEEPAAPAKAEASKNEPAKAAAKSEPLKSAAKDAAKSEPLKSAGKDAAKSEPLKASAKEPLKAALGKTAAKDTTEPLKSASKDAAKSEPLKSAAKEPLKPGIKEAPAAKAVVSADADELLDDDAMESVDAIEMDIEMPAPPPKGSRPAPPKPPSLKPPPSLPKPPTPVTPPVAAAPAPIAAPDPIPAPVAPVVAATAQLGSEPTIPASSAQAANLMVPAAGEWPAQQPMAQQSAPAPGEWPQEQAPAYGQAPAGDGSGSPYGGSPYGAGSPYGGAPDPMAAAGGVVPEPASEAPPAKSKTPLFAGIAALVAILGGASYFLLVKPSTGNQTAVVDAGQDAGAAIKPKEEPVKKPEPPKITGISQAEFNELWSSGESAVKGCFDKAIKKQADLEGKELAVAVEISDKGKSGEITLSGTELDDKTKKCIQKAMKKWKFPVKDKSAYTAKFPLKISK